MGNCVTDEGEAYKHQHEEEKDWEGGGTDHSGNGTLVETTEVNRLKMKIVALERVLEQQEKTMATATASSSSSTPSSPSSSSSSPRSPSPSSSSQYLALLRTWRTEVYRAILREEFRRHELAAAKRDKARAITEVRTTKKEASDEVATLRRDFKGAREELSTLREVERGNVAQINALKEMVERERAAREKQRLLARKEEDRKDEKDRRERKTIEDEMQTLRAQLRATESELRSVMVRSETAASELLRRDKTAKENMERSKQRESRREAEIARTEEKVSMCHPSFTSLHTIICRDYLASRQMLARTYHHPVVPVCSWQKPRSLFDPSLVVWNRQSKRISLLRRIAKNGGKSSAWQRGSEMPLYDLLKSCRPHASADQSTLGQHRRRFGTWWKQGRDDKGVQ